MVVVPLMEMEEYGGRILAKSMKALYDINSNSF